MASPLNLGICVCMCMCMCTSSITFMKPAQAPAPAPAPTSSSSLFHHQCLMHPWGPTADRVRPTDICCIHAPLPIARLEETRRSESPNAISAFSSAVEGPRRRRTGHGANPPLLLSEIQNLPRAEKTKLRAVDSQLLRHVPCVSGAQVEHK